jgi:F-type H+-transporting ATPase subunit b
MKLPGLTRRALPVAIATAASWGLCGGVAFAEGGITVIPDVSLFFQIANFLFLIWILNQILYKPIRKVLVQRKERFAGLEERIETFQQDLSEKEAAFAEGIREARSKGLREKEVRMETAAEQEKELIAQINQQSREELTRVRQKVAQEMQEVRGALQKEVDSFANRIGEKILGRVVE